MANNPRVAHDRIAQALGNFILDRLGVDGDYRTARTILFNSEGGACKFEIVSEANGRRDLLEYQVAAVPCVPAAEFSARKFTSGNIAIPDPITDPVAAGMATSACDIPDWCKVPFVPQTKLRDVPIRIKTGSTAETIAAWHRARVAARIGKDEARATEPAVAGNPQPLGILTPVNPDKLPPWPLLWNHDPAAKMGVDMASGESWSLCPDCNGSGKYQPLTGPIEDCRACGGKGRV